MMMKNQNGNALIIVLLVSLVFTTIGLAIVASTISGTKRVETRESDIDITYKNKKVLEEIISEIAESLDNLPINNYTYENANHLYINNTSFEKDLKTQVLIPSLNSVLDKESYKNSVECLSIVDLSSGTPSANDIVHSSNECALNKITTKSIYTINKNLDFTRVLEIILVTKNPNKTEGNVTRTLKKRIILSSLPSFLKYAVGSDSSNNDEGLFLNGSPNINGNIYANQLAITNKAKYQLKNGRWAEEDSLMPSITGSIYSSTANLIPVLIENNFYKRVVPTLNHDSQFINIDFDSTIVQKINNILNVNNLNIELSSIDSINNLTSLLKQEIASIPITEISNTDGTIEKVLQQETPSTVIGESLEKLKESYRIESTGSPLIFTTPIKLNGDVVINSNDASITFKDKMIVDGDLYLVSNDNLAANDNIFVTGDIHIINFDGNFTSMKDIIAAGNIIVESEANQKINNKNGVTVKGTMLAGGKITIRPFNTSINFQDNLISLDAFTIKGDETGEEAGENDTVQFNSVVYSLAEAFLSNSNIVGAPYIDDNGVNKLGQLVLLAKKKLTITRMNEFNNFSNLNETSSSYLPDKDEEILPLQAFFYTEEDAELYGVGSLFYIKGGIFAKRSLEINAIRANSKVRNIVSIPRSSENYLSRFIVDYDKDVLLKGIDALPIVDKLQIIPDEFIIE
ncbi:hypothetical protein [Niallia sp. NCCP-28]|uniref:hypothetical protein n=1 Tax=Niallia sp. NCCP-28 TaxID=2934712 RepID=UPI00208C41C3|nr:hypothetical protein [Niallia sp. NCCP-28]GKU81454.1 hypothetical protein NCCP28_08500 [Niallia sp. NCCP-28]